MDLFVRNNYRQGTGGAGGMGIYIRRQIKCQLLNFDNVKGNFDTIRLRIERDKESINFICVYRIPGTTELQGTWGENS